MSPERVSVGEERGSHSRQRDRRQKRRRDQEWKVWYEESGDRVSEAERRVRKFE